MFNFRKGLAYDQKNITKRKQNKACTFWILFVCFLLFFFMSLLQSYELSTSKPGLFPSGKYIFVAPITLELT